MFGYVGHKQNISGLAVTCLCVVKSMLFQIGRQVSLLIRCVKLYGVAKPKNDVAMWKKWDNMRETTPKEV